MLINLNSCMHTVCQYLLRFTMFEIVNTGSVTEDPNKDEDEVADSND